jgi:hypothetical protein
MSFPDPAENEPIPEDVVRRVAAQIEMLVTAGIVARPVLFMHKGEPKQAHVCGFPIFESEAVPPGEGWLVGPDGRIVRSDG